MLRTGKILLILVAITLCNLARAADAPTDPVVVQLYVFGEPAQRPGEKLDGVLNTVKESGYRQIQAWLDYYNSEDSARTLQASLDKHGLTMPSAYAGATLHQEDEAGKAIPEILRKAEIGARHGLQMVIVNPSPTQEPKTEEELAVQAKNLDLLGESLSTIGLRLAIHQHAPEMADGAREWYYDLKHTNPEKVFFCLDVHWVLRGGQDPYQLTQDAASRTIDLHLRNSQDGAWTENLGEGDIDYDKIAEIMKEAGYRGYLTVELAHEKETQVTKSLGENLAISRKFVKEVFGK